MGSVRRSLILKLAASVSPLAVGVAAVVKKADYSVVSGDTLSGIARRHGTTLGAITRLNGITDPNRLRVGQRLRLPAPAAPAKTAPAVPAAPALAPQPVVGLNAVSNELHKAFNHPELEAAILANINRETGGTFDFRTWQKGYRNGALDLAKAQKGGYGLFQYTGDSLTGYKGWLTRNRLADSAANQIGYMKSVYGPSRVGWKDNTTPGKGLTREQIADWWHRRVETPAHTISGNKDYSPAKTLYHTIRHNRFMKNNLRSVNGVWQEVN